MTRALLLVVFLYGCSRWLSADLVEQARASCDLHGGVERYSADPGDLRICTLIAYCKDGVTHATFREPKCK